SAHTSLPTPVTPPLPYTTLFRSARTEESLERAARTVRGLGVDCLAIPCDVRDPESADTMAAGVLQHFGHVNVVVANAGIAGAIRPMHEITYEEWRDCLTTDLGRVDLSFRPFLARRHQRAPPGA